MNIHGAPLSAGDGKPMTARELRQHEHPFTYPANPPAHYGGITRGWPIEEAPGDHDFCISSKKDAIYSKHRVNRMLQRKTDEEGVQPQPHDRIGRRTLRNGWRTWRQTL